MFTQKTTNMAVDLKKAESLADNIMNAAAAVSLFAAAAYVGRRFV